MMSEKDKLQLARNKEINAFNDLFKQHESQLKPYLYRLLTNRENVEDFYHNTFIKAFDKIETFEGNLAQFKSWIFTIATRLAYNHLKREKRWQPEAQDICRDSLVNDPNEQKLFETKVIQSNYNVYEIKEHIDFCFTCLSKTMLIDMQVALLLKNVCDFKVKEVAGIMNRSPGQVKHLLLDARKQMSALFENRCALINKEGTCHQCSELQGLFNPKTEIHRELMKIKMVKDSDNLSKRKLFKLREKIIKAVNPTENNGMDLHEHLMKHMKKVNQLK